MIIVRANPPLFNEIVKAFPSAAQPGALFTFGNRIYNPSGVQVPRAIMIHEEVHHQRQGEIEIRILDWWRTYLANAQFRLEEEIPAHRAEYKAFRGGRHGFSRNGMLHHIAERLSGPFYGNMISYADAVRLITADV